MGGGKGGEGLNSGNILEMELPALTIRRMKGGRQRHPVISGLGLWALQPTAMQA